MEAILKVKELSKQYERFKLDHVSFEVPKGSIMGLIGENGAGKSTTIHAILDLIQKDSGEITFWGKKLADDPRSIKEKIGVVFDELCFHETLTPTQVGKLSSLAYKQWDQSIYDQYLERFHLNCQQPIKEFSKGMKMKLSLTIALSHHPQFLILDEATSGLDPVMREEMLDIFLEFVQDENHAILMSSHITTDLEKVADYITFIHQGKVLFCKPKDELRYQYGIVRCGEKAFHAMEREDMLAFRKCEYQWEVLVADKEKVRKKYKEIVVDDVTIDELLVLYVKGENVR